MSAPVSLKVFSLTGITKILYFPESVSSVPVNFVVSQLMKYSDVIASITVSRSSYSRIANKPTTRLRHLLTNLYDRDESNDKQGAVYKSNAPTARFPTLLRLGRNLNTRLSEYEPREIESLSANTTMAKLTNQFQRNTSSTDKHFSLDYEDDFRSGCRNVSHKQHFLLEVLLFTAHDFIIHFNPGKEAKEV